GVFQLESDGMRRVCMELRPSRFEDIIALVALYRPGPMDWIPQYISNKHGRTKPTYLHPKLEPILSETYGVACYQEQVMQMARDLAGFSMGQADELRKVMGKKQKDKIPAYREKFVLGALEHSGIERGLGEQLFAFIEPFAGYGFNKSHAAAYGWIAYQTAYLKANHPLPYLAALMSSVKDKTEKLVEYIDECKSLGIAVLPPDVNESLVDFGVVGDSLRFGLAAIKGAGEAAVRAIIATRDLDGRFLDLFDLARRVDAKHVNRRVFESLIKCGALDSLPGNRGAKLAALDLALDAAARATRDAARGQFSLFGAEDAPTLVPQLPDVVEPNRAQLLAWEKETLGIYISGHPLTDIQPQFVRAGATLIKELRSSDDDASVTVGGIVTAVRRVTTKSGTQMLIASIEDTSGSVEVVVFAKLYANVQQFFTVDALLLVKGRMRLRERPGAPDESPPDCTVNANDVSRFEPRAEMLRPTPLVPARSMLWNVRVRSTMQIDRLAAVLDEWPGEIPVIMHVGPRSEQLERKVSSDTHVELILAGVVGSDNVWKGEA
ncbi:MAG: DNA polymerase III subunit alpha, partial [Vulcanimicrobiaceae bacterium]